MPKWSSNTIFNALHLCMVWWMYSWDSTLALKRLNERVAKTLKQKKRIVYSNTFEHFKWSLVWWTNNKKVVKSTDRIEKNKTATEKMKIAANSGSKVKTYGGRSSIKLWTATCRNGRHLLKAKYQTSSKRIGWSNNKKLMQAHELGMRDNKERAGECAKNGVLKMQMNCFRLSFYKNSSKTKQNMSK